MSYKFSKENNELVVRIPLRQKINNPYDEDEIGECDNLIGVIAKDEFSLSQAIDMTYKGKSAQEGMPIIMFETREELEKVCKDFGIEVWEMPICGACGKAIRGSFTSNKKRNLCFECELNRIRIFSKSWIRPNDEF